MEPAQVTIEDMAEAVERRLEAWAREPHPTPIMFLHPKQLEWARRRGLIPPEGTEDVQPSDG